MEKIYTKGFKVLYCRCRLLTLKRGLSYSQWDSQSVRGPRTVQHSGCTPRLIEPAWPLWGFGRPLLFSGNVFRSFGTMTDSPSVRLGFHMCAGWEWDYGVQRRDPLPFVSQSHTDVAQEDLRVCLPCDCSDDSSLTHWWHCQRLGGLHAVVACLG